MTPFEDETGTHLPREVTHATTSFARPQARFRPAWVTRASPAQRSCPSRRHDHTQVPAGRSPQGLRPFPAIANSRSIPDPSRGTLMLRANSGGKRTALSQKLGALGAPP